MCVTYRNDLRETLTFDLKEGMLFYYPLTWLDETKETSLCVKKFLQIWKEKNSMHFLFNGQLQNISSEWVIE
jgi:hypothetical protein